MDHLSANEVKQTISAIMREAGLHPSLIYAFQKTGLMVVENSHHTEEQRNEFIAAANEWYDLYEPDEQGDE